MYASLKKKNLFNLFQNLVNHFHLLNLEFWQKWKSVKIRTHFLTHTFKKFKREVNDLKNTFYSK